MASQALFPANGNKEYYFWRSVLGKRSNARYEPRWYSYDWGDAHLIVLDTEQPFGPGSEQYDFLQADLNAHQSEAWRIAVFQRPPYSSTSDYSSSPAVVQYLVPLFQTKKVALVLSGNSHNYERTHALINDQPVTKGGVTYVVSGAGGNSFNTFTSPTPAHTAFREDSYYEFVKVTVSPTALQVDAIAGDTNTVFDSTTIAARADDTTPPATPTGLTAGAPTANRIPLSWQPSADDVQVADYEIYRDGGQTPIGTSATTTFTDTGLEPDHNYTYAVIAVDNAGNASAPSFALTARTADDDPGRNDSAATGPPTPGPTGESAGPKPDDCGHDRTQITTSSGSDQTGIIVRTSKSRPTAS